MATLYFKAAGGNFNGANWSTTGSGGGDSNTPTAADNCIVEAGSGNMTMNTGSVCRSLDYTSGTGVYAGTVTHSTGVVCTIGDGTAGTGNKSLTLSGSATHNYGNSSSGYTIASSSATQQTVTFNGKSAGALIFASTGSYIFGDNCTAGTVTHSGGTLDTGNYSITAGSFNYGNANTRTLTLGSSAITVSAASNAWTGSALTNQTMTANTAVVTVTGAASTANLIGLSSKDWNGLSFVFTGGTSTNTPVIATSGATIKDITFTGTASQNNIYTFSGDLTVTGTFTSTGDSAVNRVLLASNVLGTARTITAATTSITNADFRDITAAGAGSWAITGGVVGDRLGNTGITFTTPATQTRDSTNGQAWSVAARWTSRVPLPQDDVVLNASSGNISATDVSVLGKSINASAYAGTITATSSNIPYEFFGDISLGGTFTQPNTFYIYAYGRSSHTITSNGKTMWGGSSNNRFYIFSAGGTYTLADALVMQAGSGAALAVLGVQAGTFDTSGSNYSVTTAQIQSATTTYTRAINFRASTVTLFGIAAQTCMSLAATNLTFTGSSATFNVTGTTSATKTWAGGGQTFGTVTHNSSGSQLYVSDTGNTFTNYTGGAGTGLRVLAGGTLTITNSPTLTGSNYGYQRFWTGVAAGAFVSAPDSAALSITGDIDIRVKVALDDWTPSTTMVLLSKWGTNANRSYYFNVSNTGTLQLLTSSVGSATSQSIISTTTTGITDGTTKWVRATLDVDNGSSQNVVKFYTSDDGSSWTQLGSTVTTAGTQSIYDGTARLMVGGNDYQSGTSAAPLLGRVYQAQVRNNILDDGTGIQFDADFSTKTFGDDSFTESSTNAATVTIEGNATYGDGRIGLDTQTGGSAATLSSPALVDADYMKIKDSTASNNVPFYAGANSVNVSGNTNWTFTARPSGFRPKVLFM